MKIRENQVEWPQNNEIQTKFVKSIYNWIKLVIIYFETTGYYDFFLQSNQQGVILPLIFQFYL